MTTTARRTLAGLAAVAIILIAGGLLFDRHETQAYSEWAVLVPSAGYPAGRHASDLPHNWIVRVISVPAAW
ncbi:hypothetical protein LCL87_15960 [Rhodococcus hoagii]|nr:hypothetical protein [Prescottella equi]